MQIFSGILLNISLKLRFEIQQVEDLISTDGLMRIVGGWMWFLYLNPGCTARAVSIIFHPLTHIVSSVNTHQEYLQQDYQLTAHSCFAQTEHKQKKKIH